MYTYRILLGGANSRQNHEKNPLNWCTAEKIKFRLNSTNSSLKYTPDKWGAKWGDREREKVDPCGSSCSVVYSLVQIVNWVYLKKKKKLWTQQKKLNLYFIFYFIFFFLWRGGKFCLRFAAFGAKCLECTSNCFARRNCGWPLWRTRTVRPSRAVFPATKLWPLNCWAPYWRLPRRRRLILVRLAVARPPFQWPAHPTAFTWQSPFRDSSQKELTSKRLSSV